MERIGFHIVLAVVSRGGKLPDAQGWNVGYTGRCEQSCDGLTLRFCADELSWHL